MLALVAGCCSTREYAGFFNTRTAARDARRYRRRGLRGTARELVELAGDVTDATVLDIGGGIGSIELELLAAGAATATSVELSDAYEGEAAALLAERGLAKRVERRVADFVVEAASLGPHDIVVLHRVVCCYPDADALVASAAGHTRRRLLLTYPQERRTIRVAARAANAALRLVGSAFRAYVHPVARIAAAAGECGLTLERRFRHGLVWETAVFYTLDESALSRYERRALVR